MPAARRITPTVPREYFERRASSPTRTHRSGQAHRPRVLRTLHQEATLLAADPDAKPAYTALAVVPAGQEDTACSFCGDLTGPNRLIEIEALQHANCELQQHNTSLKAQLGAT